MSRTATTATPDAFAPLRARWQQLASREKTMLITAAVLVGATLLWLWLLAPSLQTLRTHAAQTQTLDRQLQHMVSMQSLAKSLQQQAPLGYDDALRALNLATKQTLGSTAQISVNAERANVTLQATTADALAQWLAQARLNARSVPLEARLNRMATPTGVTWSGVLVMSLPAR